MVEGVGGGTSVMNFNGGITITPPFSSKVSPQRAFIFKLAPV